jgi:hypothetical protein
MRRSRKLAFESLEERTLLSAVRLSVPLAPPPIVAPLNPGPTVRLTTNQPVYRVGQPVVMTLTETNTNQHDINVFLGPSSNGLFATRDGGKVLATNSGVRPMFLVSQTIKPGDSITLTAK